MEKIKVLHILYELYPSGAEVMLNSAFHMWDISCEMTILATGKEKGPYAETLEKTGYKVELVPTKSADKVGKIQHIIDFYKFMKKNKYDVVHIHRESLCDVYAAIAYKTGVRTIIRTVHNNFAFKGKLQKRKQQERKRMQDKYGVIFTAISDGVEANEKKTFNISCDKKIYNWCDDRKYQLIPDELRKNEKIKEHLEDKLVLITTGNCYDVKNHKLLMYAISKMKYKEKIKYFHIGFKEGETQAEEALVKELHLDDIVIFAGFTEPESYMKKADIFVMPSLFEGLSIAAVEALFTGMKLLLADTPGLVEFQNKGLDNISYFHIDTQNPLSDENIKVLADKLDSLTLQWENGTIKTDRQQAEKAKELYSVEVGTAAYLKLYQGER